MFFDLNAFPTNSLKKTYDVCICGAGPAGITIARVLAEAGKTVALLEGGSLEFSEISQNLYHGKSVGLINWDAVTNCRLRYFGGTSNHWGGRCSFLDPVDFDRRDYFELPGWPIGSREAMFKHLESACAILDLPKNAFKGTSNVPLKGSNFRLSDKEFSPPTRFKTKYFNELKSSDKIDLYINANLTNIKLHENLGSVSLFEIQNYKGGKFFFSAKKFILALGAIENARLLLSSDSQMHTGVGNQHDMVGRCFMEHFNVELGRFVVEDQKMWEKGIVQFNPTETLMKSLHIGNAVLDFNPHMHQISYGRLRKLKDSARNFVCKSETLTDLSRKMMDFDCTGDGVITSLIEQTPNLESRITLDSEKDMFGMRRVVLNWRPNKADNRTIRVLGQEVAKELARYGVARVQLQDFILDEKIDIRDYGHHCHQMGTTRISDDPKFGVVDNNQRVHGLDNFYIAGSSVFSTGGGCNPTLTIVMMSLRLGNHIASLLT